MALPMRIRLVVWAMAAAIIIGADITAAQSLSNALGLAHPVQFVKTAWANLTTDLAAGKFDIAMGGISLTLLRSRSAFFSTAIQRVGKTGCIRCSDSAKFTSLSDIDQAGVKVVVNPGGSNYAFDVANLKSASIVLVEDNNAVYEAVLDGSADAMISDLIEDIQLLVLKKKSLLKLLKKLKKLKYKKEKMLS